MKLKIKSPTGTQNEHTVSKIGTGVETEWEGLEWNEEQKDTMVITRTMPAAEALHTSIRGKLNPNIICELKHQADPRLYGNK